MEKEESEPQRCVSPLFSSQKHVRASLHNSFLFIRLLQLIFLRAVFAVAIYESLARAFFSEMSSADTCVGILRSRRSVYLRR